MPLRPHPQPLKAPDFPPEKTHSALKKQLTALDGLRGRNHRDAENDETEWKNLTLNILTRGFGEVSNNVSQFHAAKWAGRHHMGGMSEGLIQRNFERRIEAFTAMLKSSLAELEILLPEPETVRAYDRQQKPPPQDVAQVCRNGHLVLGSVNRFPQFRQSFCTDCGAATIEECQTCHWQIAGVSSDGWMGGGSPYVPPKYCGECGRPFPWTERALSAAKEYTDEIDGLRPEEKTELKETFDDLAADTPRTPLAASRFKKFMSKIGPGAATVLQKVIESVATEAAKKMMGL
jgi:hypothetical protein